MIVWFDMVPAWIINHPVLTAVLLTVEAAVAVVGVRYARRHP